eukprot:TRINITY_DN3643_c0_g1_i10.p1 TRINITY_DN3643_c0_g1~~TRINITY_DN3643_c0_g1_i10.p1  ORF type:complete len:444 (-),score=97.20 TRINITY_DN3643_c0_g1_i10:383-1714(-)
MQLKCNLSSKQCIGHRVQRVKVMKVSCVAAPEQEAVTTKVRRNENIGKLQAGYLFPEIGRKRRAHQEANPDANVISLGIGDTTEPIPQFIAQAMADAAAGMATQQGYAGYGPEQGIGDLRQALVDRFYGGMREADEVFVSDGSKCDIGRMQMLFGAGISVAVQDPSYPAYVDSTVMMGSTGTYDASVEQFKNISYLKCTPQNDFFPDLSQVGDVDVIFFCSPNNPTGAAATREQLTKLVEFARSKGCIIVYDAAYALFIQDQNCPKTIYEIPGAEEVAIETCSFSKYAGFTGVRLGWTVVPHQVKFSDGHPVNKDWTRVMTTLFNGASRISQAGGLACLKDEGFQEMTRLVGFYKQNADILSKTFRDMGFTVYGGENAPYVWVGFPGRKSWEVFEEILTKCDIVTTPGSGFGPGGEGFVRASAFGSRDAILEAAQRFKKAYGN